MLTFSRGGVPPAQNLVCVMDILLIYLLLGCFAGLIGGMLGIGGGIVVVPALVLVFHALDFSDASIMHLALGTSLAAIVLTSFSAMIAHQRLRAVAWRLVAWLIPGLGVGALLGAVVADMFSSTLLQALFGVFEVTVGVYMLLGAPVTDRSHKKLRPPELTVAGSAIGTVSAMMGIGGGTMMVPYLSWRGRAMTEAVATSSACGFFIALFGTVGYVIAGANAQVLPEMTSGYLYWPAFVGISIASLVFAPLGAKLAHRLPVFLLRRLFSLVLVMVGATMLISI